MSETPDPTSIDLIRWSFTVDVQHAAEIEDHLADLGLDVLVRENTHFLVTWDEPEGNLDEVVEDLWAIHGTPFEITQEEFHRQNLLELYHEEHSADAA